MSEPKTRIIGGIAFEISQPYAEGHVLNAIEARVLNQTRSENIGNNVRAKIAEMKEAGTSEDEIRALVSEVDSEYVFNAARDGTGRVVDPYEREARKIGRELLRAHLAETGRKLNVTPEGLTDDEWKEKIENEVDRIASNEEVLKAAKKNVDAKKKQGEALLAAVTGAEI